MNVDPGYPLSTSLFIPLCLAALVSLGGCGMRSVDTAVSSSPIAWDEAGVKSRLQIAGSPLGGALLKKGMKPRFVVIFAGCATCSALGSLLVAPFARVKGNAVFVFSLDKGEDIKLAASTNPSALVLDQLDLRLQPAYFDHGSVALELDDAFTPIRAFSLDRDLQAFVAHANSIRGESA